MLRRHLPLLLVVTAIASCAVLLIRALDGESPDEGGEIVETAGHTPQPLVMLEPEPPREREASVTSDATPTPAKETLVEPEPPRTMDDAEKALDLLATLLKSSRSTNDAILDALAAVQAFYLFPPAPPGFVPHAVPKGGPSVEGRIVSEANLKMFADEQGWPEWHLKLVQKFRKGAERQFLKALKLQRVDRETQLNTREPVNVEAAKVLGASGNPKLYKKVLSAVERSVLKAKYKVSSELYDAGFTALAPLGGPDALEWFEEEFGHSKTSPPHVVDQAVAAHAAMLLFDPDTIPAKSRYRVVQEFVKTYAGVEALSGEPPYDAYWKRIGPGVIEVLQHFSGRPRSTYGQRIDTVAGFTAWFREHKNPRKPPWKDASESR